MTLSFPSDRIYSAAMSHSSMVAEIPRFKRTGLLRRPTVFKSSKLCMLRAPICTTSTYFIFRAACAGAVISVTIPMPVSSLTSASILRPSSPIPWNE